MRRTHVIRYRTAPGSGDTNQQLVLGVVAELDEQRPPELDYAAYRLGDGESFLHVVSTDADADPLPDLAAFQRFQHDLAARLVEGPIRNEATLLGRYDGTVLLQAEDRSQRSAKPIPEELEKR
jgi:hypothetical protein